VGIRDKLKRLERAARGELEYIELSTGERFWYEPMQAGISRFLWSVECAKANRVAERPDPPPIIEALVKARDRRAAFNKVYSEGGFGIMPVDPDALIERGELVHVSMIAGRDDPDDAFVEDLSEP
jgi:hypothetical protein